MKLASSACWAGAVSYQKYSKSTLPQFTLLFERRRGQPMMPLRPALRPHVDLAGDGGGDQGGAAFLQEGNGAVSFGAKNIERSRISCNCLNDVGLLLHRREVNIR